MVLRIDTKEESVVAREVPAFKQEIDSFFYPGKASAFGGFAQC
jgi:hypothetical protein